MGNKLTPEQQAMIDALTPEQRREADMMLLHGIAIGKIKSSFDPATRNMHIWVEETKPLKDAPERN